jgi:hypothetical protein
LHNAEHLSHLKVVRFPKYPSGQFISHVVD